MVEDLIIHVHADKKRILRHIKSKAIGCGSQYHWLLRKPISANQQLYLRSKDVDKRKGQRVAVRRVLYYLEYRELPLKRIKMICDRPDECINPAHMRIRGWEQEANYHIDDQVEKGWLSPEDAKEWFGWENKHNVKPPIEDLNANKCQYENAFGEEWEEEREKKERVIKEIEEDAGREAEEILNR